MKKDRLSTLLMAGIVGGVVLFWASIPLCYLVIVHDHGTGIPFAYWGTRALRLALTVAIFWGLRTRNREYLAEQDPARPPLNCKNPPKE